MTKKSFALISVLVGAAVPFCTSAFAQQTQTPPTQPSISLPNNFIPSNPTRPSIPVFDGGSVVPAATPPRTSIPLPNDPSRPVGSTVPAPTVDDVMTLGTPPRSVVPVSPVPSPVVVQRPAVSPSAPVSSQGGNSEVFVSQTFTGSAKVIDGNTIIVSGQVIVLHGADAPELDQNCTEMNGLEWRCGEKASRHLAQLLASSGEVVCVGVEQAEGAVAATCRSGNTDFAAAMIRDGFAVVPHYLSPLYSGEEGSARSTSRGVWSGGFTLPWEYRAGH